MRLTIDPQIYEGDPFFFMNWRLILSRIAGYGVEALEIDGTTFLIPSIDYESLSVENTLGIWDIDPTDVLLVLLAHSDEEGAIYPVHLLPLADRLEELLPEIPDFSHYEADSRHLKKEISMTEKFIAGCRKAHEQDRAVTFHLEDFEG